MKIKKRKEKAFVHLKHLKEGLRAFTSFLNGEPKLLIQGSFNVGGIEGKWGIIPNALSSLIYIGLLKYQWVLHFVSWVK